MRILVAGGSGTIGRPLVRALRAAGHDVTATTRTPARREHGILMDALNRAQVQAVVAATRPDVVIHQLTALPPGGPQQARDMEATNRLRIEGTAHLVDAAIATGVRRFVVGSSALLAPRAARPAASTDAAVNAVELMEQQALAAAAVSGMTTTILRYGLIYGPAVPSTCALLDLVGRRRVPLLRHDTSLLPYIHIDDAVAATVAAVTRGQGDWPCEIVDDEPMSVRTTIETMAGVIGAPAPWHLPAWLVRLGAPQVAPLLTHHLVLSNTEARRALHWSPRYRDLRQGLVAMVEARGAGDGSFCSGARAGLRQVIAA